MKKPMLAAIMLAFLSLGFQSGTADRTAVDITLFSGMKMSGEILAVRDSSIVIVREVGISSVDLMAQPKKATVLPFSGIMSVQTPGTSHILVGAAAGMAIGCVAGCAIGESQPVEVQQQPNESLGCGAAAQAEQQRSDNEANGALIGGLGGAVIGGMIGGATSSGGLVLVSPERRDFNILKSVARYTGPEPDYLRSIAP